METYHVDATAQFVSFVEKFHIMGMNTKGEAYIWSDKEVSARRFSTILYTGLSRLYS